MNVSRVYFSERMYLNHAAENPCFSIVASLERSNKHLEQYRFMNDQEAHLLVSDMLKNASTPNAAPSLLHTSTPNIIIILLESFGAGVVEQLGGIPNVTPHLNELSKEGLFFKNLYAGSFRTDRGLTCALSGYPAQPTMSIIKYPTKSQTLKSIPSILKDHGYHTSFLYGGDLNFAYIKSYLVSQGVVDLTQQTDFPLKERYDNWGAPDHITFDRLFQQVADAQEPFCKIFLTLSSHEPFEVPFDKFEDPYLNSVAYTDHWLGDFVNRMKQLPQWDNTLIVLLPDHAMKYPTEMRYDSPERHHIFSLWIGGAVRQSVAVDQICGQTDVAATLLNQLEIECSELPFSRDILQPTYEAFAFYTFPNGFGLVSPQGFVVYDCNSEQLSLSEGAKADSLLQKGKAYLQNLYNDIGKR
jgi:phosphoglycerol transferase MdoB-like AlkP superfamily enzyme